MLINNEINYNQFEYLLDTQIKNKIDGLLIASSIYGEGLWLNELEINKLIECCKKKNIQIILEINELNINKIIEKIKIFENYGVYICIINIPNFEFQLLTEKNIINYFYDISKEIKSKIIINDTFNLKDFSITLRTIQYLSLNKKIIGLLNNSGNIDKMKYLKNACNEFENDMDGSVEDNFLFFSGNDLNSIDFLLNGGNGLFSITSTIYPELINLLIKFIEIDKTLSYKIYNYLRTLFFNLNNKKDPSILKYILYRKLELTDNNWNITNYGIWKPYIKLNTKYYTDLSYTIHYINNIKKEIGINWLKILNKFKKII